MVQFQFINQHLELQQNHEYSKDDTFIDLAAYASIAAELAEIKRKQDQQ